MSWKHPTIIHKQFLFHATMPIHNMYSTKSEKSTYCCLKNSCTSWVEGGSLSHYLPGFIHPRWSISRVSSMDPSSIPMQYGFWPWSTGFLVQILAMGQAERQVWQVLLKKSAPSRSFRTGPGKNVRKWNRFHWGHWGTEVVTWFTTGRSPLCINGFCRSPLSVSPSTSRF